MHVSLPPDTHPSSPLWPLLIPSPAYPVPYIGSQRELGIKQTWMSADGRYGPYGYGEDREGYSRSKVDWNIVDWGQLQDECVDRNVDRFPGRLPSIQLAHDRRFRLFANSRIDPTPTWDDFSATRRTAIVLRSYEGFQYTKENMWMIRSLITEASLRTGGEYGVILLVDIHDADLNIFESQENYDRGLERAAIPEELRSITILWDVKMLESWYPAVTEHSTKWQINQPLQLLALHYPEYDHFWQIEMDQRFMGDAGEYLDAIAKFARDEPRKQGLERATYPYSERYYSSYNDLLKQVNAANKGGTRAWGPMSGSGIEPIGPEPPTQDPTEDEFQWGKGEDADVIVTSFCADVVDTGKAWVFGGWMAGRFSRGKDTPRWFCPPAVMRASRSLLLSVHAAMHVRGLSLPSEAVLPSWALYHGLKISYPPQPNYRRTRGLVQFDEDDKNPAHCKIRNTCRSNQKDNFPFSATRWILDFFRHSFRTRKPKPFDTSFFGLLPNQTTDGVSHAKPQGDGGRLLTYWWTGNWPRQLMDIWLGEYDEYINTYLELTGSAFNPDGTIDPIGGGFGGLDEEHLLDDEDDINILGDLADIFAVQNGTIYAPNFVMHPVKTQQNVNKRW